jgi:Zn-dependent protease with chaperone function
MSWHDLGTWLFAGPFRNLWPLILIPGLAAVISDATAALLPRRTETWLPAALLAALPGLAAVCAAWPVLITYGHVATWKGAILLWLTPAVALLILGRAVLRAWARQREVSRLFAAGTAPGPRLAAAAARLGLEARELPCDGRECFVAGVLRPTVFLSRGALDQLGDAELEAALHHERAHVRGGDTVLLFVLSFLRDLAPFGRAAALESFHAAREVIADREAARHAGPLNLASALVALARPPAAAAPQAALPLAKNETLRWRMQAILATEADPPAPARSWAGVATGLSVNAALLAWPLAQLQLVCAFWTGWG